MQSQKPGKIPARSRKPAKNVSRPAVKAAALPKVRERLAMADVFFEHSREAVIITDAKTVIQAVNPAFTIITGYSAAEVVGQKPHLLRSDRHTPAFFTQLWRQVKKDGCWQGELWNRRKNGEIFPCSVNISSVKGADGRVCRYVGLLGDLARDAVEERETAHYDALTGLPNRSLLNDRLTFMLGHARRNGLILAVLFIDLDRFKVTNDTLGYTIGDLLLQTVAGRLKKTVREADAVFRLGNDEFAIVLEEIGHIQDAAKVAQKILTQFSEPFKFEQCKHDVYIHASIGISLFPYDGVNMELLVKNAETAMYRAKEQGQNSYQHYTPGMNARAFEQLTIEFQLHKALQSNEFVVYYQPIIDIEDNVIVGAEALVRWMHPDMGLVAPDDFIPIAEQTGLIIPIGEIVLRTACSQTKAWHARGFTPFWIAINLSGRQFQQRHLVSKIDDGIAESGLSPQHVELEITESFGMRNPELTVKILRELRKRGIKISIDDFGTGYSSLNYLKRFPISTLKIDRSFVRDIFVDHDDAAIVAIIIEMAHQLSLRVVAEGVETEKQLAFLKSLGCDFCQGYLFSPPVPAEQFEKLLLQYGKNVES
jgi:diguanylate cyclase (GGDEF)-like protein/PAS domain S-box-containing protein